MSPNYYPSQGKQLLDRIYSTFVDPDSRFLARFESQAREHFVKEGSSLYSFVYSILEIGQINGFPRGRSKPNRFLSPLSVFEEVTAILDNLPFQVCSLKNFDREVGDFYLNQYNLMEREFYSDLLAAIRKKEITPGRIEDTLLVDGFHPTYACPNGCAHCCMDADKTGVIMPYSKIQGVLAKVRFPVVQPVTVSVGEPLSYSSQGKHIGDVIKDMVAHGGNVLMVTSGLGTSNKRDRAIFGMLDSINEQYGRGSIEVTLSFDLFKPMEFSRYFNRVKEAIESCAAIKNIRVTVNERNKTLTYKAVSRLEKELASRGSALNLEGQRMLPIGRALINLDKLGLKPNEVPGVSSQFSVRGLGEQDDIPFFAADVSSSGYIFPECVQGAYDLKSIGDIFADSPQTIRRNLYEFGAEFRSLQLQGKPTVESLEEVDRLRLG